MAQTTAPDPELQSALLAIEQGQRAHDVESVRLDFKQPASSDKETVRRVVDGSLCFANAGGGTVVLGVANKVPGPDAFVGTDFDAATMRKRIHELSTPPLLVDVDELTWKGTRLLLVRVPEGLDVHADHQGRAPRRIATDCINMTTQEIQRLRDERQGVDWSAQLSDAAVGDVEPEAMSAVRGRLRLFPDHRRELAANSDRDLLRALKVVSTNGRLLRAGEILLCRSKRRQPRVVYQHRATPGGEHDRVERLGAPLVIAFEEVMELVQARRHVTPVTLPNGQVINIEDFPERAVREVLSNAFLHRDFRLSASIHIEHSPQVFSVTSPGPLVSGVTPENIIRHPSRPRNPLLAHAARLVGLAEETGSGADRMYREMIRSGKEAPVIQSAAEQVRVALVGGAPNTQLARYVAQLPEEEQNDVDTMLVLLYLCRNKTVNANRVAPILQRNAEETEAVLGRLASATEMIEPTRETARRASRTYRLRDEALQTLGGAVKYQRRSPDDIDRKIIEHVDEYGRITNRTVRNLFQVQVHRAKDILADLVERGVIVKTSKAARGPSVEYGPGPNFPAAASSRRHRVRDSS